MNPILYAFYTSNLWVWLLRLRGRVPFGYYMGYSIDLEGAQKCVGPGWRHLIAVCFHACLMDGASIHQIKEKYGMLRFSATSASDGIARVIWGAEEASQHICEDCGAEGKLRPGGWVRTLCDKCAGDAR